VSGGPGLEAIAYYDANARRYFDTTVGFDNSAARDGFAKRLKPRGSILDAGCGSGRDALAFARAGFDVTAIDASAEMVKLAADHTGLPVQHLAFGDMKWRDAFDGIWACASLVHTPRAKLCETLQRFAEALRPGGVFWMSMKAGEGEETADGRPFTYVTEAELQAMLLSAGFDVAYMSPSHEKRGDNVVRWVNGLAQRFKPWPQPAPQPKPDATRAKPSKRKNSSR
jgi:SAM-dependent methyltransferase